MAERNVELVAAGATGAAPRKDGTVMLDAFRVATSRETNGDTIALFQELATPPTSGEVTVESRLLQDVFADETHTVNVELVRPYRILRLDARRARVAFKVGL